MGKILAAFAAVIAVAVGGFLVFNKISSSTDTQNQTSQTATPIPQAPADSQSKPEKAAATITYSGSGFEPSTVTVNSGDTLQIKNTSLVEMQFDSDPHPIHTDNPQLNVGLVSPGQSLTFTVTEKGTFGYHNHLDPSQTGKIVVK